MFSVYAVLLFGESWLRLVADLSARSESRAEFLRTALRCPASWEPLLSELKHAKTLLSAGEAPEARRVLSQSVAQVLGEDADAGVRAASLQHALEDCAVGMGAAFRLLAMSHYGDPVVRDAGTEVQVAALEVALRMQHLASGWLIYAYNVAALHHDSFIDDSAWPITSHEFGDEHRSVANLLGNLRAQLPNNRIDADPGTRSHGLTVCLVTICDYPSGAWLPRLAASAHGMYAHRHGYGYIHHRHSHHAKGQKKCHAAKPACYMYHVAGTSALAECSCMCGAPARTPCSLGQSRCAA